MAATVCQLLLRWGAPATRCSTLTTLCPARRLIKTIGFERGVDTLVWQLIASVATPGYTIHCVVAAANWALQRAEESAQVRGCRKGAPALGRAVLAELCGEERWFACPLSCGRWCCKRSAQVYRQEARGAAST